MSSSNCGPVMLLAYLRLNARVGVFPRAPVSEFLLSCRTAACTSSHIRQTGSYPKVIDPHGECLDSPGALEIQGNRLVGAIGSNQFCGAFVIFAMQESAPGEQSVPLTPLRPRILISWIRRKHRHGASRQN